MSNYLWDRSAPADPEIVRLERVLAPLAFRPRASRPQRPYLAIAASVALAAFAWQLQRGPGSAATAWSVTNIAGDVSIGSRQAAVASKLRTGEAVTTGKAATITVEDEDFGEVSLASDSRLRIVEARKGRQRMNLEQGRLHALIWAPPRQFVVDTPAARAVDLGCEYDLTVDTSGNGLLEVSTGWVAFQFRGQESFIPAGAACRTTRQRGPGIPYFKDAPEAFTTALTDYESHGDISALDQVLASARARDGLTLWHLMTRVSEKNRPRVFDRFAALVRLPAEVNRKGVLNKNPAMLDLCWNALALENAGWWREWKQSWKP